MTAPDAPFDAPFDAAQLAGLHSDRCTVRPMSPAPSRRTAFANRSRSTTRHRVTSSTRSPTPIATRRRRSARTSRPAIPTSPFRGEESAANGRRADGPELGGRPDRRHAFVHHRRADLGHADRAARRSEGRARAARPADPRGALRRGGGRGDLAPGRLGPIASDAHRADARRGVAVLHDARDVRPGRRSRGVRAGVGRGPVSCATAGTATPTRSSPAGHVDVVVEGDLKAWDVQALIPLVRGAGGAISDWSGGGAEEGGRVVAAGSAALHAEVLARLADRRG